MKSRTMHVLVGIGFGLTTIASAISTALACKEIEKKKHELGRELTVGEKIKIGLPYYIPIAGALAGSEIGLAKCYTTSQEMIKLGADGTLAMTNVLNGYRDLTREQIGKKKEAEIYSQAVMNDAFPEEETTKMLPAGDECYCQFVIPEAIENRSIIFRSTPTKIKEALLECNNIMVSQAATDRMNNAFVTMDMLYDLLGVEADSVYKRLGWEYGTDGVINVSFEGGIAPNGCALLGICFEKNPHYI